MIFVAVPRLGFQHQESSQSKEKGNHSRVPPKACIASIETTGMLRPQKQSAQINDKDRNRRVSLFEESGDLAPGQLYSTESGRYLDKQLLHSTDHHRLFHAGKIAIITGICCKSCLSDISRAACTRKNPLICLLGSLLKMV